MSCKFSQLWHILKCLLLTSIIHQGYSLFHRKPPLKFEIEALYRLVLLYRHKKKNTPIIVESIHSSLRLESKINLLHNIENFAEYLVFLFILIKNIDQNIWLKIILSYNFVGVKITCKFKKKTISQKFMLDLLQFHTHEAQKILLEYLSKIIWSVKLINDQYSDAKNRLLNFHRNNNCRKKVNSRISIREKRRLRLKIPNIVIMLSVYAASTCLSSLLSDSLSVWQQITSLWTVAIIIMIPTE
ncbi:hypothetical protein AGLY_012066 [Aphis glycines]|uniref:Uncharacterized protein n=1 Tax=Aphis glycines TaxID=307491 RepID=A0A6G0T9N2_APHGL|nr:hypothetical protein AGLY_012066 [Aphis glycines]